MGKRSTLIGELAENLAIAWFSETGAVATRASRDRNGWDLFVELQSDPGESASNCLIQVKSTDSCRRRCPVSLENWERLVQAPHPAFFLIAEFDGEDSAQRAFLVHIGKEWIDKTVERRIRIQAGDESKAKRPTITLTWSDDDRINPLNGRILEMIIRGHIGSNAFDYLSDKDSMIQNSGLDGSPILGTITISGQSQVEISRKLAEHAIGITERLSLASISVEEKRFGVAVPIPRLSSDRVESFSFRPTPTRCQFRIGNTDGTRVVQQECNVYAASAVFPFLSPDLHLVKFETEEWSVVVDPGTRSLSFRFSVPLSHKLIPIRRAYDLARMLTVLVEHQENGLRIEAMNESGVIQFSLAGISHFNLDENAQLGARVSELIWAISREFAIPESELVDLGEMLRFQDRLELIAGLLKAPQSGVVFTCSLDEPVDSGVREATIVFPLAVEVGGYKCATVISMTGLADFPADDDSGSSRRLKLDNGAIVVHEKIVRPKASDIDGLLEDRVDAIGSEFDVSEETAVVKMAPGWAN